tara:strand:+ start:12041 stop:13141 length:1101 start_codon:yes stop_codon:yes gene_type:complete
MDIPFFRYSFVFESFESEFLEITQSVGKRGAFILQQELLDFEQSIAKFCGSKYAVGVANATDGLQMAFMCGGLQQDDEVIISSHTMIATASAIHFAGGVAIPVDAGSDHLIDHNKIRGAITSKTRAICPTQLNGRTSNMDEIVSIADEFGLSIYEDAAQALGSKWKGKCAGTFGLASCISFYPAKILGCLGDGGIVLTSDDEIYNKLLLLRDHGRSADGNIASWGFNSRLDNIQAAYLSVQFKNYPYTIERRRYMADRFNERLKSLSQVVLPPAPEIDSDHFDVYQNYEIQVEDRDNLVAFLKDNGIGTLVQWGGKAIHHFTSLGFNQSLPYTDKLFERILMLPFNLSLTDDEIDYICDRIASFYS